MASSVSIVEVSPRDGLQNETRLLATDRKIELIRATASAGLRRIETTSFVHPRRVPQMADADAVMDGIKDIPGVRRNALILNLRGAQRAVEARADEVTFVVLATEEFNRRNQGCSRAESLAAWKDIVPLCHQNGIRVTFLVGASFGCPFEGEVPPSEVLDLVASGASTGADEIALADTIGCGVPAQVTALFSQAKTTTGDLPLRAHFHNTRNTGYANAFAAVEAGVRFLDSSLGGLGGCPFAPNSTGNIATEDLAWMLARSGIPTGVDVEAAMTATALLREWGYATPALLGRVGQFPRMKLA